MFPFPYIGLRLVHDEKVRDAMERARILARNPRRTVQLSLLRNVLMRIRSRLNIFTRIKHLRRWPRPLVTGDAQKRLIAQQRVACRRRCGMECHKMRENVGQIVSHLWPIPTMILVAKSRMTSFFNKIQRQFYSPVQEASDVDATISDPRDPVGNGSSRAYSFSERKYLYSSSWRWLLRR